MSDSLDAPAHRIDGPGVGPFIECGAGVAG